MKQAKWLVMATLVVLSSMAVAQLMSNARIVTEVPFDFVIGNNTVPAGKYVVQAATMDGRTLTISNRDAKVNLFSTILPAENKESAAHYALVFKQYGNQHFLAEVKVRGSKITYMLPETGAEAEWRAQNVTAKEEILLAARE
jgi:predicted aspartyl protease